MDAELVSYGSAPCECQSLSASQEKSFDDKALLISLCSSGNLLGLVATDSTAQLLALEEGVQDVKLYHTTFKGSLPVTRDFTINKEKFAATALAIVPIAFMRDGKVQRASIALVGFSDGYIRGYSKSGKPVVSEQLHVDPVSKICTMLPSRTAAKQAQQGNVAVLLGSLVCVIEGWSLVELIQRNVAKMNEGVGWSEYDEDVGHLVYKKWHLKDQACCFDITLIGHSTPSVYDYLHEASSVVGYEAAVRSGPIPEARLISVGENPIIALYKLSKDAGQVNMTEVVHAVASKMKSAVLGRISQAGGWLGWGGQKQQKQESLTKSKMVDDTLFRSSDLPMEVSIPDSRRSILSIAVSPLGNLAAAVDSFGRVMLLDCESIVVRRMWKGYRDAQCGWLLVKEKSNTLKLKGKTNHPQGPTRKVQCLCIYAAQRGILELWPAMFSRRVGAFHVGKGCRLLYSHDRVFATPELLADKASTTLLEKTQGVQDTTIILTPEGNLVTFSVPFPCLLKSDDPSSSNAYLMKKFLQATKLGEVKAITQLLSEIKSTKLLKQAVECLVKLHPIPNAPRLFLCSTIRSVLKRIDPSNADFELLYHYLLGCQQLIQLKLRLEDFKSSTSLDSSGAVQFSEFLQEMLRMPRDLAQYIGNMLSKYYSTFVPLKKVVKELDINGIIQAFALPCEVGDHFLNDYSPSENCDDPLVVELLLKDETDANLLDLGGTLFLPVLNSHKFSEDLKIVFEKSGIPRKTLLRLLTSVFLSGKSTSQDLTVTHQTLYGAFSSILQMKDNEDVQSLWMPVCRQCALTSNIGHAFSVVLVHQKLCTDIEHLSGCREDVIEDWESVTTEKGHWATLYNNLEVLLHLCNLVGVEELRKLPFIPFDDRPSDPNTSYTVDLSNLNLKFYDKVYRNSSICAASLKNAGPCLVSHCLCSWIVKMGFLPDIVEDIHSSRESAVPSHVIEQLQVLLKLLPHSLDKKHLLVHCAWQAAYSTNEFALSLHYINELSSWRTITGIFGLLWCLKFENVVVKSIDYYKRGIVLDKGSVVLISVCRVNFGYMLQFTEEALEQQNTDQETAKQQSLNRVNLMEIVESFPFLNKTVTRTCLELLLALEIALQLQGPPVNLMTLFPNWLRSALKKGTYKSSWQEQVPVQLRPKRLKFLMEAVSACFQSQTQQLVSKLHQKVISTLEEPSMNVSEFQDLVFLLGRLWKLDLDEIKNHWTLALFARGLAHQGKSMFLGISDKTLILSDLLSLAGYLTDHLLHQIEEKTSKLAILAQISPTLLEWMRKQGSNTTIKKYAVTQFSWKTVSQLVTLMMPYFSEDHVAKDKAMQLDKIIKLMHL